MSGGAQRAEARPALVLATAPVREPGASIESWLAVLESMLALPRQERKEVREELESHLRERVRDLMVGGMGEDLAVGRAIEELGSAAELATRIRAARSEPRRRRIMHMAAFSLLGGAVVAGLVAVNGGVGQPEGAAIFKPQPREDALAASALMQLKFDKVPLSDALAYLGEMSKSPTTVNWRVLEESGIVADAQVTVNAPQVTLATALDLVNEQAGLAGAQSLDYRIENGAVMVATRDYFDHKEMVLVNYDISGILDQGSVDEERLVKLITELVEPDSWRENGGELASLHPVGGKLFVNAPKRFHANIKWIIDQLADRKDSAAPADGGGGERIWRLGGGAADGGVPVLKDIPLIGAQFRTQSGADAVPTGGSRATLTVRDGKILCRMESASGPQEIVCDQLVIEHAAGVKADGESDGGHSLIRVELKYAQAATVAQMLHKWGGQIEVDQRTNALLISAPPSDADRLKAIIAAIDAPPHH